MKKLFTLMAVAALGVAAAQAQTTVKAEVKTWLSPTEFIQYQGDLTLADTTDADSYFTLANGFGNTETYPFYFKFEDGNLAIYDGYEESFVNSNDAEVYIDVNETYYGYMWGGGYFYGSVAEDYSWGYLTFYSYTYDWESHTCQVENWAAQTSIIWPAPEVAETVPAKYTCGRTGQTNEITLNKFTDDTYRAPAFLGKPGYDLDFDAAGIWDPQNCGYYNPSDYDNGYYLMVSTLMQKDWEDDAASYGECMKVLGAEVDVPGKKLTIAYQYGPYSGEYKGTDETVFTDVLDWNEGAAVGAVEADQSDAPAELFNLQGIRVNAETAAPGLYIQRQGNKATKVLR